jgi:hypothetical protein
VKRLASTAVPGLVGAAACILAVVRAATSPVFADAQPVPEELRLEAFRFVAAEEPAMRAKAMETFPADPWSQDDDFHASESSRVNAFASDHSVSRAHVWRAFDDGMREGWPVPEGVRLRATVAPCRPRALY